MQVTAKQFDIWSAERSFRYKEEAILNHAPQAPGIYQFATFDENGNGRFVFIGLTLDKNIYDVLFEHWEGRREPKVQELLKKYPNLYFGFVSDSNAKTSEDLQDLYFAMVQQEKPELVDAASVKPTGRYSEVSYKEKSIL
jgi:hypothetical protein